MQIRRDVRSAPGVLDAIVMALKGDDVVTRPATAKEVNEGLWEDADTKAL